MAMNTIRPSAGRTRNALAMATPSKKVCNSNPTSAGAAVPERANASGNTSTNATASMKPAPKATKCSISASSRAARRVTASAPTTLPSAATRAYPKALDTGQEIVARVAARILEHFREQPLEGLSHLGPGPHACGQEVVALHREILDRQRVLRGADRLHHLGQRGNGMRDAGCGMRRKQPE